MYISKIKIENYKGFNNHDTIELTKGINLIIGKNNSGKTALLEALTFNVNKPHLLNIKKNKENDPSTIDGSIGMDTTEFHDYLSEFNIDSFVINSPIKKVTKTTWVDDVPVLVEDTSWNENVIRFFSSDNVLIFSKKRYSYDLDVREQFATLVKFVYCRLVNDKIYGVVASNDDGKNEFIKNIFDRFIEKNIYKFDIHRKIDVSSMTTETSILFTNCQNLAGVVDNLQKDRVVFEEYKDKVKFILPDVKDFILEKLKNQKVEIKIWTKTPIRGKSDLSISLDDCGTGVGQVLAILYVVVSATEPKVILIDEPNSFLHPSASRKLLEVLAKYPQHQYFVTTHSPELISNFGDNILHTQLINGEINVKQIDGKNKKEIENVFSDLGIRLSDVYGFDSVFWVEGETEEKCLPLILKAKGIDISNTAFLSVKNTGGTGKFDKDYINNTVKIYSKLSLTENTYIPPAIGFFFDNEGKDVKDIKSKLGKEDKGKVIFTEKKLYENYLLNEDAIFILLVNESAALFEICSDNIFSFTRESISKWIESNKFEKKYWVGKKPTPTQKDNWGNEVHGADLLEDLFKECFGSINPYKKTNHSVALTKIILDQNTDIFNEFVEKISKILNKSI
jgi:AAA15 family ATPase/GTPase